MALDLGSILVGLGGQYINARWGQNQYGPSTGVGAPYMPGGVFNLGVPGVDVIPEPSANCSTKGLVYDPEKGKWIKRRRRRRRRLVTPTDIKDIAALKAIIGNGQALQSAVIKAVN